MRAYLSTAPWWVLSLVQGTFFGTAMTIFIKVRESPGWTTAVIAGAVGGILFGALMGPSQARQFRRQREATGDLSPRDFRVVQRATRRGPVPTDPGLRAAAARSAAHQLDTVRRYRRSMIVAFGLGLVMCVVLAFGSLWWLAVLPFYGTLLGSQWYLPKRLEHRLKLLSDNDSAAT